MGTYLVVMDRAIPPQSLRFGLLNLASRHKPARFVLLQTPQLWPGDSLESGHRAAAAYIASARSLLTAMGLSVVATVVGDPLPRKAIAAEMAGERTYEGIVLTSKPPSVLRLLQIDVAHQLERKYRVPVICIDPDTSVASDRAVMARSGSRV